MHERSPLYWIVVLVFLLVLIAVAFAVIDRI